MEQNIGKIVGEFISNFMREEQMKKVQNYAELNPYARKGAILFTGSSLMEQFPVCEYCANELPGLLVYNRGVGGFTTDDFLQYIHEQLLDLEPSTVFINIGTNDMNERSDGEDWLEHLLRNYRAILQQAKEALPETKFYLMAYYPVNPHKSELAAERMLKVRTKENLAKANAAVKALAEEFGHEYIDVGEGLADENGDLKLEYTVEGVHMFSGAYHIVFENLKKYLA